MIDFELSFLAAFLIGLAGAGHCMGMCGGIVSALALGTNASKPSSQLVIQLCYNLGRITSYTLIALAMALFFSTFTHLYAGFLMPLRTAAGMILILMGLYLLGQSLAILKLERLGKHVWQHLQPYAKRLMPVKSPYQALLAGAIWGWLPCGLVYSSLIWVSSAGTPLESAWLMLAFGLGTLPAMLFTGLFSHYFKQFWARYRVNQVSGTFLVLYGVWSIPYTQQLLPYLSL